MDACATPLLLYDTTAMTVDRYIAQMRRLNRVGVFALRWNDRSGIDCDDIAPALAMQAGAGRPPTATDDDACAER